MDYTPHWANKNFSHQWNALLYQGKTLHFVGTESAPGRDKIVFTRAYWVPRKRAKVFRHAYSLQTTSLAMQVDNLEKIPEELRSRHIKDVTSEYVPVSDVKIKVNGKVNNADFAYLCVFNDQRWKPVYWGEIGFFNKVNFTDMERGVAYLPVYYDSGQLIPAAEPIILTSTGDVQPISPSLTKKERIVIKHKYPEDKSNDIIANETYELYYWKDEWVSLGKQKAIVDSLVYSNVPQGALLMVKNVAKGKQERIFTYKNKQIWW
jgi:hypothetical protein